MATLPLEQLEIIQRWGPHRSDMAGVRLDTGAEPDRLVKTHCCFCGQQCGIQLKVKDEKIVGFEPWEEFPFNKGKLCPKGVKRYMQDEHPDRLLTPLARDEGRGFQPIEWDGAPQTVEYTPTQPGERCVHHIYKDAASIPEEVFARVGKTKSGPKNWTPMGAD